MLNVYGSKFTRINITFSSGIKVYLLKKSKIGHKMAFTDALFHNICIYINQSHNLNLQLPKKSNFNKTCLQHCNVYF